MATAGMESMLALLLCLVLSRATEATAAEGPPGASTAQGTLDLIMPSGQQQQQKDVTLCYSQDLAAATYITGFKPLTKKAAAFHAQLYGCAQPGSSAKLWDCGAQKASPEDSSERGPVCEGSERIIYSWGVGASELNLPRDVGFVVGGDSGINSLVVRVRYGSLDSVKPPPANKKIDSFGVRLTVTTSRPAKMAGVYVLVAGGDLPPHSTTYMEAACVFNEPLTLRPFAFHGHTDEHGAVVKGYRVREGQWTEIGRMTPQQSQMFHPVSAAGLTVSKGDILATRCTMVNNGSSVVSAGNTAQDGMCTFSIMFHVDEGRAVQDPFCFSPGPLSIPWSNLDNLHPGNASHSTRTVPDIHAFQEETRRKIQEADDAMKVQQQQLQDSIEKMRQDDPFKDWNKFNSNSNAGRKNTDSEKPLNAPVEFPDINFPPINIPDLTKTKDFEDRFASTNIEPIPDLDKNEKPHQTETVSIIKDTGDGGKGYEKTQDVFEQVEVPGGKGYYKSSSKQSGYSWSSSSSSDDSQPKK